MATKNAKPEEPAKIDGGTDQTPGVAAQVPAELNKAPNVDDEGHPVQDFVPVVAMSTAGGTGPTPPAPATSADQEKLAKQQAADAEKARAAAVKEQKANDAEDEKIEKRIMRKIDKAVDDDLEARVVQRVLDNYYDEHNSIGGTEVDRIASTILAELRRRNNERLAAEQAAGAA